MGRAFPQFGYNPVTGEWNDSLKGDYFWSSVNLSEAVPDVMTPSTWSLLWIYFFEIHPVKFPGDHPICGNICGRPYVNLSMISSLYHAVGRDASKEKFGDLLGSVPSGFDIPFLPFSPQMVIWHVLPGMFKDQQMTRRDCRKFQAYLPSLAQCIRDMRPSIRQCTDASSLLTLWTESIRPEKVRADRVLRSITASLSEPATKLNLELIELVGESESNTLLSNFSGAAGDLESLGPLLGLARVKDGRLSREEYMEQYGHRGPHEVELFFPAPADDPDWFEKRFADFTDANIDVDGLLEKQRAEYDTAWRRFEARFPKKFRSFRRKLDIVTAAAKNRELIRSESIRLSRLIRQFLLQVGSVIDIGDGIFFLSLDEMTATLNGNKQPLDHIFTRREMYERYCSLPPYPSLIYGRFDPFMWASSPNRRNDLYDARQSRSSTTSSVIKGYAGSAGIVEGAVRRIDCVEDGSQIQPGEILVTIITNIGWTPLFPRLAAIVTDVGAPLSHAAIVAREMGIPAVVGCGNATMLLKTGDRVRVDGGRGLVEQLRP
jgi:pyruvate,water dikinase